MSLSAFAEKLGVTKTQLYYFENENSGFSLKLAIQITQACNVSLDWLMTGKDSPSESIQLHEDFIKIDEDEFLKLLEKMSTLNNEFRDKL